MRASLSSPAGVAVIGAMALVLATAQAKEPIAPQPLAPADRRADFQAFVEDFQDNYAYRDRADRSWRTWIARYRARVDAAATPEDYAAVFESALDELHDFHAEVRSPNPHRWLPVPTFADMWAEFQGGDAVIVAVRRGSDAERAGVKRGDRVVQVGAEPLAAALAERLTPAVANSDPRARVGAAISDASGSSITVIRARAWALLSLLTGRADEERHFTLAGKNGASRPITLPLERQFARTPGALSSTLLPGDVGLVRFNNSLGDQATVAAFDSALERLRPARGLILDLRDVPSGGDSSVALGIMGRLVRTMLPYQRHRIPHYGQPDVERNWIEQVAPRGPFTYDAPVVVLVDHWTGSMGEGMAIGLDGMRRAMVVGTRMAAWPEQSPIWSCPRPGSTLPSRPSRFTM